MIISDLNHVEVVSEETETSIEGGCDNHYYYYYSTNNYNYNYNSNNNNYNYNYNFNYSYAEPFSSSN
jgi:hypothetical protein